MNLIYDSRAEQSMQDELFDFGATNIELLELVRN